MSTQLGHFATTITVIGADGSLVDTATVGTTPTSPLTRSTDGNVVYQAFVTATDDGTGNYTTKTIIVVFDTDTGTSAPEIEMLGTFPTDPRTQKLIGGFTDKGDNIYVVTESYDVNDPEDPTDVTRTTHVAIINTETGEQLGDPVAIDGRTLGGLIVDGDRAYQRTVGWSPSGDEPRIRIGVIDANTGDLLSAREIDGSLDQYTDGRTGEVFFDRLVFTDTDGDGINDRVHQAAASQNADGTYTVRIVTLNARTGDLIKTESVPVSSNGVKILEAKDNGRVYLVVNGTDYSNPSGPSLQTTFVTIDADTGEVVGAPVSSDGGGAVIYDADGIPSYLVTSKLALTPTGYTVSDVTFTPLAGQPWDPIVLPGSPTAFTPSPDGTLAYIISEGDDPDESVIQVIDLQTGTIVATSTTVPGRAGVAFGLGGYEAYGGLVFDADGKGYLTTWIKNPDGSYTTQVPACRPRTDDDADVVRRYERHLIPTTIRTPIRSLHRGSLVEQPGPERVQHDNARCYRSSARSLRKRFIPSIFSAREASGPA